MKIIKLLLIIKLLVISTAIYAEEQILGKYPKVYTGDEYVVTILRLGKTEDKTALIKVDGIDNDYDGQIYKHTKKCDNQKCTDFKYETKEIPGKKRWWTIQTVSSWADNESLVVYPPGIDKKTTIFKIKRPKDFDKEKFYKEYLGQKAIREKSK